MSLRSIPTSAGRLGLYIDGVKAGHTGHSILEMLGKPEVFHFSHCWGQACLWSTGQSEAGGGMRKRGEKGNGGITCHLPGPRQSICADLLNFT